MVGEHAVDGGGDLGGVGPRVEEIAVDPGADEVARATAIGPHDGHARGLRLLDGLTERLEFAGVAEHVHGGVGLSESVAVEFAGEDRVGHGGVERGSIRSVADHYELQIPVRARPVRQRPEPLDVLLRGESADESHDRPAVGRPQPVQGLAAPVRVEADCVDAPPPAVESGDSVGGEVVDRGGGGGEGAVAVHVQGAGPGPGGVGHDPDPVGARESGHVGLVDGHGGHVEDAGGRGPGGAEDERRGQVDDVRGELAKAVVDARAGRADGQ